MSNDLVRCPACETVIKRAYLEELEDDEVVGCDYEGGHFQTCESCRNMFGQIQCNIFIKDNKCWTVSAKEL